MTKKNCNHYPILNNDLKKGGCWEEIERTMDHVVRRCVKCGAIDESQLISYSTVCFNSQWKEKQLQAQNNPDSFQPWVNGKPNEKFAKAYHNKPDILKNTFTSVELNKMGMPKLAVQKESGRK